MQICALGIEPADANDWRLSHSAPARRPNQDGRLTCSFRAGCAAVTPQYARGRVRVRCNPRLLTPQKFLPAADLGPTFHLLIQPIKGFEEPVTSDALARSMGANTNLPGVEEILRTLQPIGCRSRSGLAFVLRPCPSNLVSQVRAMAPARPI